MELVWRIASDYLFFVHHAFGVEILAFVLMDNHFHLIAKFPGANLSEAMQYFMRETSRSISQSSGRINHVYGGRVFRSRIGTTNYLRHAYKYVYRNPVHAGLSKSVESYRYSTLRQLSGFDRGAIPLMEDPILFGDGPERTFDWLNTAPLEDHRLVLKAALRRSQMRLPRNELRKLHLLETETY